MGKKKKIRRRPGENTENRGLTGTVKVTNFSERHVNVSSTSMIDGHSRSLIRVIRMRKRIRKGLIVRLSVPLTIRLTDPSMVCAFLESKIRRSLTCSPTSIRHCQSRALIEKKRGAQWHDSTPMQMSVPLLFRASKRRTRLLYRSETDRHRFYGNSRGETLHRFLCHQLDQRFHRSTSTISSAQVLFFHSTPTSTPKEYF